MGAGESWGKGCCRSQGTPGPCSNVCGVGEGSGGGGVSGHEEGELCTYAVSGAHVPRQKTLQGVGGRCQSLCWLRSPQPNALGVQGGGQPPQSRGERE